MAKNEKVAKKAKVSVVKPAKSQELSVVPAPKKELILEGDPDQQLQFAQKAAKALMNWIGQKPNPVMIRGEQYLEFGDWQILGRFYGATVAIEWSRPYDSGSGASKGWEARSVVYRNGEIISSAEAMCVRAERRWATADEYAVRSMAQTRASAKALRQAFGWVAELAGMKSTPAEEMSSDSYDKTPVEDDVVPTVTIDDHEAPVTPQSQREAIFHTLKARGVNIKSAEACKEYIQTETGYDLKEENFGVIIKILEH